MFDVPYFSGFSFRKENNGGTALRRPCVQTGTFTIGLILILVDLLLSNPFFILLTCLSLLPDPCFLSSIDLKSRDFKEDEDEDEDGDRVEDLCFLSLTNSFHRTLHLGGLGEGSSSSNQPTLVSGLLLSSALPASACCSALRLIVLSFSGCCICQTSEKSSSADSMVWFSLERNSNSTLRVFSFTAIEFGFIEMKSSSSSELEENEIRGLEIGLIDLEVA